MMKCMKTTMTYLGALLMLGALAFSCNKIENQEPTPEETTQTTAPVEMTFTTTMAAKDASSKAVDADGVTTWVVNEKIAVYYQKSDDSYGTATANVDAVNAAGVATISASLTNAKNSSTVKFVYPASLVNATGDDIDAAKLQANQHGTIADISANFDAATGSGTLVTDGSTCGTDALVTLTNQLLIGKFTPKFSGAAIDEIMTLTVSDGTNTYTVTPTSGTFGTTGIYVAMLPVTSQVVSLTAETASASYIYPGKSVTLAAGKLYNNLAISCSKLYTCSSSDWETKVSAFNADESENPVLLFTGDISLGDSMVITRADGIIDLGGKELYIWAGNYIKGLWLQNDVAGKSITVRNGTLSRMLDGGDDTRCFAGTVIVEDLTFDGHIFTDGHPYVLTNVNFINACGTSRLENYYYYTYHETPHTVVINSGKYNCAFNVGSYDSWLKGSVTIYGGKFRDNPSNIANVTFPSGYSVKSNTDSDSATYPYIVSAE